MRAPPWVQGMRKQNAVSVKQKFKQEFKKAALERFGSGWAWVVINGKQLSITTTPNQDSPVMEGKIPVLGLAVWEHAYYLKYQNQRGLYIDNWWNVFRTSAKDGICQ